LDHSGPERRKSKRFPELFFVKWQTGEEKTSKAWTTAYLKNISRSGLAMQCGQKLALGDKLNLSVTVHVETAPCRCVGEVVWIRQAPEKIGYEVGLRFVEIGTKDADWINVLAEEFERKTDREKGESA
jgi:Tfp pilus assembly protein PilZ